MDLLSNPSGIGIHIQKRRVEDFETEQQILNLKDGGGSLEQGKLS